MSTHTLSPSLRGLLGAAAGALWLLGSPAHANIDISDVPLYALEGVAPNLALTIDDSGSMAWAYVPDGYSGIGNFRRGRSGDYNVQYYNPNITYEIPPGIDGQPLSTSFTSAYLNGFRPASGTRNLSNNYRVTWVFNPANNSHTLRNVLAGEPSGAFYYVFDASLPFCNDTTPSNNDNCYRLVEVSSNSGPGGTDERQNFANWYSFYRTRNLATVSAASIAFQRLPAEIRVGWQALNSCTGFPTGNSCRGYGSDFSNRPAALARFEGAHKTNFFQWLQRLPASGGTPLLPRVEAVSNMYGGSRPYAHTPGVQQYPEYECRPNISLVMTDGVWNNSTASASIGNADNESTTFPDGVNYSPKAPYAGASSRNLADIAFEQWATDLRTDLPASNALRRMRVTDPQTVGNVTVDPYWNPRNDPSTWQNIITYTLGVGLSGFLGDSWDGDMYTGDYSKFVDGSRAWPNTGLDVIPGNIYDLWHAAINGRGLFFSADSPDEVVTAFNRIISSVLERTGSAVAVSMSAPRATDGTLAYQVGFNTTNWSGALYAYKLSDGSGGAGCNAKPKGHVCDDPEWNAADLLVNEVGRQIITNNDGTGVPFTWGSLSTSQQNALRNGHSVTLGQERLAYLRGDRSKEGTTYDVGSETYRWRTRATVLGDIMNAHPAPLHVGPPSLFYPDPDYATFRTTWANRQSIIYVGANDGMLHAFDAENGEEIFAFVPAAVYPNLHEYTYDDYEHNSYVDGGLSTFDVKIGGSWRTVLIGALGLGGRSIFALDITNPAQFTEGSANNVFMWEFTHPDLGYVMGSPEIVQLRSGEWAAVFSSGYNSPTGSVSLFIVDIATGNLIRKIEVDNDSTNGLASVTTVDLYGNSPDDPIDGKIEYAVAGDLKGNLWVFDLTPGNTSQWDSLFKQGSNPRPVFIARDASNNRQPITSAPAVGRHPTNEGMMVYFGTGRYLGANDLTDLQQQSFYGIWVKTNGPNNYSVTRSNLLQQEILVDINNHFVMTDFRATTQRFVDWEDGELGWYLDFNTEQGERVFQRPILRSNRIIFTSTTPSDNPCSAGGTSWIYELGAHSGNRLDETPFDYNFDGSLDGDDMLTFNPNTPGGPTNPGDPQLPGSGIRLKDAGIIYLDAGSIIDADDREVKAASTSDGDIISLTESKGAPTNRSWRELVPQ